MANIHSDKGNYARFAGPSRAADAAEDKLSDERSLEENCSQRAICSNVAGYPCVCEWVRRAE